MSLLLRSSLPSKTRVAASRVGFMVLAYHICVGAYGFWLPNDPRGSGSSVVWAEHLRVFGAATKLEDRSRSVAGREHDISIRRQAKLALKYPAVHFTSAQEEAIGRGFCKYITKNGITCWACCILSEHVHLVVARHSYDCESIIEQLKGAATRELIHAGIHPLAVFQKSNCRPPPCWQRGGWFPFLNTPTEVRRSILYVENNPEKEGRPRQLWPFVLPFDL